MKRVVFVCVQNSNRSQMAEAFARLEGGVGGEVAVARGSAVDCDRFAARVRHRMPVFPGGRDVLAALDDALCERLLKRHPGEVAVFEDQYASTGGQLYGLAMGQDRFVADFRPLVQPLLAARGVAPGHRCHPYDLCTKLIAEEAGIVVTGPDGGTLCAPLNTENKRRLDWLCQPSFAVASRDSSSRATA